eukprot:647919-Rhodomonas_salina.3
MPQLREGVREPVRWGEEGLGRRRGGGGGGEASDLTELAGETGGRREEQIEGWSEARSALASRSSREGRGGREGRRAGTELVFGVTDDQQFLLLSDHAGHP